MGYRCIDVTGKAASSELAGTEVLKRETAAKEDAEAVVLMVGNDEETLSLVNEDMDGIAARLPGGKQMDPESMLQVEENAQLFEQNLKPLFTLISATSKEHVMDKLSVSLKKALLMMAMERYSCDREGICRALGISQAKLESELNRCGLPCQQKKTAPEAPGFSSSPFQC